METDNSKIKISLAEKDDIELVFKIATELNLSYWSADDYLQEVREIDALFLTAKEEQKVVGFLLARLITFNDHRNDQISCEKIPTQTAEIYNIGLKPNYQRKKIGFRLITHLIETCKRKNIQEIWLEVRENNRKARSFYNKIGFKTNFIRKDYYRNPIENALVMKYEITK